MKEQKKEEMVIISVPFNGTLISFVDTNGIVEYSNGQTYQEYKQGKNVKLVTWYDYEVIRIQFFCKQLIPCSEQDFDLAHNGAKKKEKFIRRRYRVIFGTMVAPFIFVVHVYDKQEDNYYTGIKTIMLTDIELYKEIIKDLALLI